MMYSRVQATSPSQHSLLERGSERSLFSAGDDEPSATSSASLRSAIAKLSKCSTAAEVRTSLQRVLKEMERCDANTLSRCRAALDAAVPETNTCILQYPPSSERYKQRTTSNASAWTRENRAFFVSMLLHFYKGDRLSMLPREVSSGSVLSYCDVPDLANLASVSRCLRATADSDATWRAPYDRYFGTSKDGIMYDFGASLKESYHQRIRDPTCGDRVEVAWQGRFRLEGLEVYRGLAWWAAEVAEKRSDDDGNEEEGARDPADDTSPESPRAPQNYNQGENHNQNNNNEAGGGGVAAAGAPASTRSSRSNSSRSSSSDGGLSPTCKRYKVHYLNWDSRWDEWVSRDQLRWPVQEGKTCSIAPGDDVEVWCSGNTVPGAWLRAVVDRVEDELFCVGNVASSGHLWVSRDRVRLVHRSVDTEQPHVKRSRVPSCLAAPVQKLRDFFRGGARSRGALSCVFGPFTTNRDSDAVASHTNNNQNTNHPQHFVAAPVV